MVTLGKTNGRHALLDEGKAFFSTGINHVEPHLLLAPYNWQATLERYGSDFVDTSGRFNPSGKAAWKWIEEVFHCFEIWGFNTFGYHTSIPLEWLRDSRYYYVAPIRSHVLERFCPFAERPDVFSPEFEERVEESVKEVCEAHRGAKNLLGYAFSDVPDWNLEPRHYPEGLPERHPWVEELAIKGCLPMDPDSPDALPAIAERWIRVHVESVRRNDPNHLILGDKTKLHSLRLPWMRDLCRQHYDLLLVQVEPDWGRYASELKGLHRETGLPVLLGDSAFSIRSEGHTRGVKGIMCTDEEAAGKAYTDYLKTVASIPFIVGWHICGFTEGWPGSSIPERSLSHIQCGLMDPFGKPYAAYVTQVADANRLLATSFTA